MLKVSIASLKFSNPLIPIHLIIDKENYNLFLDSSDNLLNTVDVVVVKDVPKGSDAFKSRFLKTMVGFFVECPFIFLDSDTIVRKELISIFNNKFDLACALNHNRENINEQIFDQDLSIFRKMNWCFGKEKYYNSGVLFFKNSSLSKKIYLKWNKYWLESYENTGLHVDQPAFYRAIEELNPTIFNLPYKYNAQIKSRFWFNFNLYKNDWDAVIWHYYGSMALNPLYTSIEEFVLNVNKLNIIDHKKLDNILSNKSPWRNENLLDKIVIFRINRISKISGFYKQWISGNRIKAIKQKIFFK